MRGLLSVNGAVANIMTVEDFIPMNFLTARIGFIGSIVHIVTQGADTQDTSTRCDDLSVVEFRSSVEYLPGLLPVSIQP